MGRLMAPIKTQLSNTVHILKTEGSYFAAGAVAFSAGMDRNYGCHFGMRSSRDAAIEQFYRGYDAARQEKK